MEEKALAHDAAIRTMMTCRDQAPRCIMSQPLTAAIRKASLATLLLGDQLIGASLWAAWHRWECHGISVARITIWRSQQRRAAESVDLLRQLRAAAFGPVGATFRLDGTPHESGILGRELSNLLLHIFDHATLFGDLVFDGDDPVGHALLLAGSDELVEDTAVIGVDGIAADARLAGQCCDGQARDSCVGALPVPSDQAIERGA
ncbi:hypothetical protein [Roseicella sp. DB1501]|uniref:hypothetical protein n=1 Tax=Roseicella sp. DB1501 TaxID=2730925 RepID=UPI001490F4E6|nr:hypothetical protein [Roseicella sp. DB1501]NOG70830.1 hypothetical protein [Roseicella sp. DB1501]